VLQADTLLLAGTLIVDEAVLTGGWSGWQDWGWQESASCLGCSVLSTYSVWSMLQFMSLTAATYLLSPFLPAVAPMPASLPACRREHPSVEEPCWGGHRGRN
jgi:di/tricarboxylate transporter